METNKAALLLLLVHMRKNQLMKKLARKLPVTALNCFPYSILTENLYQLHSTKGSDMSSGSWHTLHIHRLAVKRSDLCDDMDSDYTEFVTTGISVQL